MIPGDLLTQVYAALMVFGWGFLILTFAMGGLGDHHGDGGGHHHLDNVHGLDHVHGHGGFDHGHAIGQHAGHSHVGNNGGAHGHSGHSGAVHGQGGHDGHGASDENLATNAHSAMVGSRTSTYFKVLSIVNPMSVSTFMGMSGTTGLLCLMVVPMLGFLTLIPASIVGVCSVNVMRSIFAYLTRKLEVSNVVRSDEAIGHIAEVSAPIGEGRTGEVTYVIGTTRFNSAAKCSQQGCEIKKGDKVLITDKEGYLVMVEPIKEERA